MQAFSCSFRAITQKSITERAGWVLITLMRRVWMHVCIRINWKELFPMHTTKQDFPHKALLEGFAATLWEAAKPM